MIDIPGCSERTTLKHLISSIFGARDIMILARAMDGANLFLEFSITGACTCDLDKLPNCAFAIVVGSPAQ